MCSNPLLCKLYPQKMMNKPLLAATFDAQKARYPYLATPKVDGIRFLMVDGKALSRSFKPIRNKHIQALLCLHLPNGMDGEITCGNFQESTSAVMSMAGEPKFTAWIFDYVKDSLDKPYTQRLKDLVVWFEEVQDLPFNLHALIHTRDVTCEQDVLNVTQEFI
jgi:hypothetical protein